MTRHTALYTLLTLLLFTGFPLALWLLAGLSLATLLPLLLVSLGSCLVLRTQVS